MSKKHIDEEGSLHYWVTYTDKNYIAPNGVIFVEEEEGSSDWDNFLEKNYEKRFSNRKVNLN